MLCYVKTTQNQNEAISSFLQYGHIVWKDCFVVFTGSWFPNIMLCPNLMKMKMEGTAFSWRIRAAEKYSSTKKLLLSKSPQNTRSAIKCCYLCEKRKTVSQMYPRETFSKSYRFYRWISGSMWCIVLVVKYVDDGYI